MTTLKFFMMVKVSNAMNAKNILILELPWEITSRHITMMRILYDAMNVGQDLPVNRSCISTFLQFTRKFFHILAKNVPKDAWVHLFWNHTWKQFIHFHLTQVTLKKPPIYCTKILKNLAARPHTVNRFGKSAVIIVFNVWWVKSSHMYLIYAHEDFS